MLRVLKFGGTSVGTPERIRAVAARVAAARRAGDDVAVVVSAMGDTTDELSELAARVSDAAQPGRAHPREMDMLLSCGERISMALLAMAIREQNVEAMSLTGSQAAIITDEQHTGARIQEIRNGRVREALAEGVVPIVAGFQGVSRSREVTTLGRGGSDTTAVALAVALGAHCCEIFTDVDGVYTADPRRVPEARRIPAIGYDEMLELAAFGAQVIHGRALELGARWGIDTWVRSTFAADDAPGTRIKLRPPRMEDMLVTGIASSRGQAKVVIRGLPAGTQTSAALLGALADDGISVDIFAEVVAADGRAQAEFSFAAEQAASAADALRPVAAALGATPPEVVSGLARVALVGTGMHGRPGTYARAFQALAAEQIAVHAVSTSAVSVSLLVPEAQEPATLLALHRAFGLDRAGAPDNGPDSADDDGVAEALILPDDPHPAYPPATPQQRAIAEAGASRIPQ